MVSSFKEDEKVYAVLFVDDEENILRSIRRSIVGERYIAHFAGSGAAALKIMEEHEIAVIVTDMKMPVMDGLQLLKIVKEKYPNMVKIVLSGFTQLSQVLATVNQADIFNFIAKPWDMESELKYVIDKAIEHYQLKITEVELRGKLEKRNVTYQTILKKMEVSSGIRAKQIQHIKKISQLLLETIEKNSNNESKFLVALLNEYTEKLPGLVETVPLEKVIADLKVLVGDKPYYSEVNVQVKDTVTGKINASISFIYLAVTCLLNILQQNNVEGMYIFIVSREREGKAILSFSMFFLDPAGLYQKQLAGCSYPLIEEVFRDIMDARFVTSHKEEKHILQLEFELDQA